MHASYDSSVRQRVQADDLVRMANQVAQFFEPYPEADAIEGIRDHLEKFWNHAMRSELAAVATGQQATSRPESATAPARELSPRVVRAIAALQSAAKK